MGTDWLSAGIGGSYRTLLQLLPHIAPEMFVCVCIVNLIYGPVYLYSLQSALGKWGKLIK